MAGWTRRHSYVAPNPVGSTEFAGRHNRRPLDTEDMMAASVRGMAGKRLPYAELIAESPGR